MWMQKEGVMKMSKTELQLLGRNGRKWSMIERCQPGLKEKCTRQWLNRCSTIGSWSLVTKEKERTFVGVNWNALDQVVTWGLAEGQEKKWGYSSWQWEWQVMLTRFVKPGYDSMVMWNREKKTIAQNESWKQKFTENKAEEDKRWDGWTWCNKISSS